MDWSPPDSSVHWILQARIQEWVAIPFLRVPSRPRHRTRISCIAGGFWAGRKTYRPLHKLGSSFPTPPSLTLVTTPITVQSQQTCFCFLNIYDYFLHDCMSSFFHVFRTYWFIRVRRSTGAGVVKVVKSEMDSPSWRLKPSWNVFIILYTFFFSFFLEYLPLFFNAWKIHIHILRFRSKIPLLEIFLHYFSLRKIILS